MTETPESKALNWVARIWSVASILFVLAFIFGDLFSGSGVRPTAAEWLGLVLWPGGVIVGLIVAWFRKGLGGAITIGSLIAFYVWNFLERGTFPRGPYFALVAAPGILFLLSSVLSPLRRHARPA
ncbi:MAG: hypothetical protein M3539_10730 [Acidobacteriota bacterium]|nr:hypothetical protein [Acidobacteriota bacterium]